MPNRTSIINEAASKGVLVVSPHVSREINLAEPGDRIDFQGGDALPEARVGHALGKVGLFFRDISREGVKDLFSLKPLSDEQRERAGLPPKR